MKQGRVLLGAAAVVAIAAPATAQTSPVAVEFTDNEPLTVTLEALETRRSLKLEVTNTLARKQTLIVRVVGLQPVDAFSRRLFRAGQAVSLARYETKPVPVPVARLGVPKKTSYAGSVVVLGTRGPLARRKLTVTTDVPAGDPCAKADALKDAGQDEEAKA